MGRSDPSRSPQAGASPKIQGSVCSNGGDWGIFRAFREEVVTPPLSLKGRKERASWVQKMVIKFSSWGHMFGGREEEQSPRSCHGRKISLVQRRPGLEHQTEGL